MEEIDQLTDTEAILKPYCNIFVKTLLLNIFLYFGHKMLNNNNYVHVSFLIEIL